MKTIKNVTQLIILHSVFWFSVQMVISHLGTCIATSFFDKYPRIFRSFSWEQNGELWDDKLKVSRWKKLIPEGAQLNKNIYNKSQLTYDKQDIHRLLLEMRRAELIHWISILPVLIFIKAPKYIRYINVIYVVMSHIPVIITQRYNRPRIERLECLIEKRGE